MWVIIIPFLVLWIYVSFFRLGMLSSIILLKIFTGPLIWNSSFLSICIILRFGLLIVSWISWMFWVRILLYFYFLWLLCLCSLWNLLHLRFSLPPLVFCCWWLHLWFLISFLGLLSPELSPFVTFSLLFILPPLDPGWFCSIPSLVL